MSTLNIIIAIGFYLTAGFLISLRHVMLYKTWKRWFEAGDVIAFVFCSVTWPIWVVFWWLVDFSLDNPFYKEDK